jgi:heat shock protein HslJ
VAIALVALGAAACTAAASPSPSPSAAGGGGAASATAPLTNPDLVGTEWVLGDLPGQVLADVRPTISFSGDGTVTGNAGCNTFNATYTVTGDTIEIGPIMSTKMACEEPMATVEAAYLAALEAVNKVGMLDNGKLQLWDDGGKTTLAFIQAS